MSRSKLEMQDLGLQLKAMLREKYLFLNACILKEVKLKINELRIHLKKVGKKLQIKSKESRKKNNDKNRN